MFNPSGLPPMTTTSAPARRYTSGARSDAAPCAQSTTTRSPPSGLGVAMSRWSRYRRSASTARVIRPTPSPIGNGEGASIRASMASSTASSSLSPPAAKILMPLSGIALCEAEITTPRSAPISTVRNATAGVGNTPSSSTSTPAEARPAATAASSISPLARGSRPMTAVGLAPETASAARAAMSTRAAEVARRSASSGVRSALARPRTPSVPKSRGTSALGVLRRLPGLLQAVLLALLRPGVTGEESGLLEGGPVGLVQLDQRAGNAQPQRTGLAGDAAAAEAGVDVVDLRLLESDQRLLDQLLVHLVREVGLQGAAVQGELAGAGNQADADHGFLAAADGLHRPVDSDGHGDRRNDGGHGVVGGVIGGGVVGGVCTDGVVSSVCNDGVVGDVYTDGVVGVDDVDDDLRVGHSLA